MLRNQMIVATLVIIATTTFAPVVCRAQTVFEQWIDQRRPGQFPAGQWLRPMFDRSARDQGDDLVFRSSLDSLNNESSIINSEITGEPFGPPSPSRQSRLQANDAVAENSDPVVIRNQYAADLAYRYVLERGLEFGIQIVQREATKLTYDLDHIALTLLNQNATSAGERSFELRYRQLLGRARPQGARFALFVSHLDVFRDSKLRPPLTALLNLADAVDTISSFNRGDGLRRLVVEMDRFGSMLGRYRTSPHLENLIDEHDFSVMEERNKGMRTLAMMMDVARTMAIQRNPTLVAELQRIGDRAQMSPAMLAKLTAIVPAASGVVVPEKDLPPGYPASVIYNPLENTSPIHFACNDSLEVTLKPGELAPFGREFNVSIPDTSVSVPGDRQNTNAVPVTSGVYRWTQQSSGWHLQKEPKQTWEIDASFASVAFHYLINGQRQVVHPGASQVHRFSVPVRIDFETGHGDDSVASMLVAPGRYFAGVDLIKSSWRLFKQTGQESEGRARRASRDAKQVARLYLQQAVAEVEQGRTMGVAGSDGQWLRETDL